MDSKKVGYVILWLGVEFGILMVLGATVKNAVIRRMWRVRHIHYVPIHAVTSKHTERLHTIQKMS